MKTTALRSCTLALGLALSGSIATKVQAADAFTDPVGYYTLEIAGSSDNVMSLPMVRDAVFAGTVGGNVGAAGFDALAGTNAPGWQVDQFKYTAGSQPLNYYVEFTSGALKGLYYRITTNTANAVTLDTEGDLALNAPHAIAGNPAGSLTVGDSFKIRPYWRIKDVFEVNGQPIIEGRNFPFESKDSILIPNYVTVGINKAPNVILFYLNGTGWQKDGELGPDYGDFILRPNEVFIVRRMNANGISLTNLGSVLMNRSVSFVPGGGGGNQNDTYIALNRPSPVSLDDSGLQDVLEPTLAHFSVKDQLLVFSPGTGFNRAPSQFYYFLAGQPQGQGWRKSGDIDNTTIGQTVFLEPGKAYILRKGSTVAGKDWVNDPNY